MTKKRKLKINRNLRYLECHEVEKILDSLPIEAEEVSLIADTFADKLKTDDFSRINDILNMDDLTKYDELVLMSTLVHADVLSMLKLGKLSRHEIIYIVKNNLVTDNDLLDVLKEFRSEDLAQVILHWRPQLFDSILSQYRSEFKISQCMIDNARKKLMGLEKFKFVTHGT